jgi:microcystin-dependent protein
LPIASNDALFSLIGTTYGGDGQTTFALPDLRGRVPIHQGSGLSSYSIGENGGVENVTLTVAQVPAHGHSLQASTAAGTQSGPAANMLGAPSTMALYSGNPPNASLNPASVVATGGGQPHDNFQPYLCVSFILSLFGIFPSQS